MSEFNMKLKQAFSVPKRAMFKIAILTTCLVSGIFVITKKYRENMFIITSSYGSKPVGTIFPANFIS